MKRYFAFIICIVFILILQLTVTQVTLKFDKDIIRLGETIRLICRVDEKEVFDRSRLRQWFADGYLIYLGGKSTSDKYEEIISSGNQFELMIRNVTESDLNRRYECMYNFGTDMKWLNTSATNFEYPPSNDAIAFMYRTDKMMSVKLYFNKVFPYPNCTVFLKNSQSSSFFEDISSQQHGIFYKVDLLYQSVDKNSCKEDVVIFCRLILQYQIPTKIDEECTHTEKSKNYSDKSISNKFMIGFLLLLSAFSYKGAQKKDNINDKLNKTPITNHKQSRPSLRIYNRKDQVIVLIMTPKDW